MSDLAPPASLVKLDVIAELIRVLHVTTTGTGHGGKKTRSIRSSIETKTKQFIVELCDDVNGYAKLMQTILDKHRERKYGEQIDAETSYSFKYYFSVKKNALDVDTFEEYQDLIRGVQVGESEYPIKLTVVVRLEDVERAIVHSKQKQIQERDLDPLELSLAENWVQLEKKYANVNAPGWTLKYDGNYQLSLTPAMMKERPVLNSRHAARLQVAAVAAAPTAKDNDAVVHLAIAVLEFVKVAVLSPHTTTAPCTPKRSRIANLVTSPTHPPPHSPNDTVRFLKYMKDNHGVIAAPQYVEELHSKAYGPDILDQVDVKDLTDVVVGLSSGDAIRLRRAAPAWWNGHDFSHFVTKHHASQVQEPEPVDGNSLDKSADPEVEWYYCGNFPNGTMQRWLGSPLIEGDRRETDNYIQYQDIATEQWLPIPPGFTAPLPGDWYDDNGDLVSPMTYD
ncbi:hypothetical protein BDY19DRAFT_998394 [Irpex rosettiformis]|uniref:Uncharacterized protein n=1 Tax=Irpex rosettiformis TaxID=378272 RepID=A0ACB8TNU2_9APHY|nr:hypothetical protein BDY19DRAFT_998394 [Irpex rosettiformis]